MKKTDAKTKLRLVSLMLFFAVLAVWALSYFIISNYIADNTKKQMTVAAEQIIERLGGVFSQTERLSYSLTQNADVAALLSERNSDKMFSLINNVERLSGAGIYNAEFVDSIVLFGADRSYHRLAGKLGNKECSRLAGAVFSMALPSHISTELDNRKYIGYADKINLAGGEAGAVVILIEDEKILEIIRSYDQSGSLLVAIKANGEAVAANTDNLSIFMSEAQPVIHSRFGITPYEISVAAQPDYMNASVVYFTIVALITAAIFGVFIYIYANFLSRRFFRPMVSVIGSIENLNTSDNTDSLPYVQSEEFDGLIAKINEMLNDIETKNAEVKGAELRASNAEIEKQKALVFSLKKQINAHFTINTLEAISSLIEQEKFDKAETVSSGLIHLVSYAYDKNEYINAWDELDILQKYVAIMNSRYGGKIENNFDFDDRLMDYHIPRMLLQPIIENAIHHGFKNMASGCVLSLRAELQEDNIYFNVSDNGKGMSAVELTALNKRLGADNNGAEEYENIALMNIKNRLYNYYGNKGLLNIRANDSGGVCVEITIPSKTIGGDVL